VSNAVRPEVEHLVSLGVFPDESIPEVSKVEEFQRAIEAIQRPVSTEEAARLITVFGPDDSCFGLAWAVLHLIESAPDLPFTAEPAADANEWIKRLWLRAHRDP
jgi:hypothetical protein